MEQVEPESRHDLIIIGGGVAGAMAAHAARARQLDVLILEKSEAPVKLIGSGIATPELLLRLEDCFGPLPRTLLRAPGALRGLRLHLNGDPIRSMTYPWPAFRMDRQDLTTFLEQQSDAPMLRGHTVTELQSSEEHVDVLTLCAEGQKRLRARVVIDTAGSELRGSPDSSEAALWRERRTGRPRFIGRVVLHAEVPDPGWQELSFGRGYVAHFHSCSNELVVEAECIDRRLWRKVWSELIPLITGPMKVRILRELAADFSHLRRRDRFNAGSGRVLMAGDAAGAAALLGHGLEASVETGLAAGEAAAFADGAPDCLTVYRQRLAPWLEQHAAERSPAQLRRLAIGAFPFGLTLADCLAQDSFFRRISARRRLRKALEVWLSPKPYTLLT